ncbi:MAG: ABC transporter permease [Clostridiales bacterium]|jgi:putative ABC transport system permease protein|nr:ABC transporter permease [Clostridiales bacterium]
MGRKPVILTLAFMTLKKDKGRSLVAAFAIVLTSAMITTLFTLGGSLVASAREQTLRMVGTRSHGGLQAISMEQYKAFAESPVLADISYSVLLAEAENENLSKLRCEIRYAEDKMASWNFSMPTTGKMPREKREIACGTAVLDILGAAHELGTEILLEYSVNGVARAERFALSGFWESKKADLSHMIWLSRERVDEVLLESLGNLDYDRIVFAEVWFRNPRNIAKDMNKVIAGKVSSNERIYIGVNWAYATAEVEPAMIFAGILALGLAMLSGYLIIYSILAISVSSDTRNYGLMKMSGATSKQIFLVVLFQAGLLSSAGIPIGLAFGFLIGNSLAPAFVGLATSGGDASLADPRIFAFAALFSLAAVIASCFKPSITASQIAPIESLSFQGGEDEPHQRKTGSLSLLEMAFANAMRDKKKLCAIVLSLSVAFILLNSVYSAIKSFDMDQYVKGSIITDFAVYSSSLTDPLDESAAMTAAVSPELLDGISQLPGIEEVGSIYFLEEEIRQTQAERFEPYMQALLDDGRIERTFYNRMMWNSSSQAIAHIYGIGGLVADSVGLDRSKLENGAYVSRETINGEKHSLAIVGDVLLMADGSTMEVVGLFDYESYPFSATARHSHAPAFDIIMSDKKFLEIFGTQQPMQTNFNISDDGIAGAEEWLTQYTTHVEPNMTHVSREHYKKELEGFTKSFAAIGTTLSFMLALVGILNFANIFAASIASRKREFAMLQAIGMTGAQLRTTLALEGLIIAALSTAFTATAGLALEWLIIKLIAGQVWFFKQSVSILPSLACLPILIAICAAAPVYWHWRIKRDSVADRIRTE